MGASTSTNRPSTTKLTDGENHRVKYASSTMQGLRMSMEDSLAVELDLDGLTNTSFFGVYDGHGGAEVAMYCAKRFHVMLRKEEGYLNNLPSAIKSVCFRIDDDLKQSNQWRVSLNPCGNGNCFQFLNTGVCPKVWRSAEVTRYVPPLFEGSTACVVIIRGNQITVGNVGDSRCVLSKNGQAIDLSTDHKPNIQLECRRIQRAGGQVWRENFPVKDLGGEIREQWGPYCVEGKLDTSRAIGDFGYKNNKLLLNSMQMVICDPDICVANITGDTEFLVIASDGIWDHMSSQDVVDFVYEKLYLSLSTEHLCHNLNKQGKKRQCFTEGGPRFGLKSSTSKEIVSLENYFIDPFRSIPSTRRRKFYAQLARNSSRIAWNRGTTRRPYWFSSSPAPTSPFLSCPSSRRAPTKLPATATGLNISTIPMAVASSSTSTAAMTENHSFCLASHSSSCKKEP
ncbi:putative protein phosphatase 2C 22 isoform X1 [Oryza brachyantha]|uniref:putative protein phosphatase 2C 22 isoform X1 n=1 Tax=Oryza brachyantha TaxID=4533 RepID=UPI0007761B07|nr:putative protein phosphatase 2C 22 isoform X1 [Oryza brachyantha]XP_015689069.1 putative protein phosphatase 2C 22 isoform X1 [Oryza brachyantha]XP_015689070.1 putative protein phosphatase 2C 22 isoform X1 [Oryza brachyantha]